MANPRLIICGSIALDRIMDFSGKYRDLIKPDKLHVLSLSVLLDKMEETPGGVAANIAQRHSPAGRTTGIARFRRPRCVRLYEGA